MEDPVTAPPPPPASDAAPGEPQAAHGVDALALTIGLSLCFLILCAILLLARC
jgi:hypothetical protein